MKPPTGLAAAIACATLVGCAGPATQTPVDPAVAQPFSAPAGAPTFPTNLAATTPGTPSAATPRATTARVWEMGRRAGDLGEAVQVALPVAAAHLGGPARTHLHVESVDAPGPGAAVVVLVGIELRDGRPVTTRLAVPVLLVDGHWAAGLPWTLPAPAAPQPDAVLDALPSDDPAMRRLAVVALEHVGWQDVTVEAVGVALDAWPHIVTFSATDRQGQRTRQTVWLRRHLDQFVVAGTTAPHATSTNHQEQTP